MKYKVHRLEIKMENDQDKLEQFLNKLEGDVVSIIPNIKRTSLFKFMGLQTKSIFCLLSKKFISSCVLLLCQDPQKD